MRALQELIPNCNKVHNAISYYEPLSEYLSFRFQLLWNLYMLLVIWYIQTESWFLNHKVDKASMLDEAIEYLKTLQLQVQVQFPNFL